MILAALLGTFAMHHDEQSKVAMALAIINLFICSFAGAGLVREAAWVRRLVTATRPIEPTNSDTQ